MAHKRSPNLQLRALRHAVGENIRRLRLRKGYTLAKLSRLCGITPETLDRYEMGRGNPDLQGLLKVSQALRSEVAEILRKPAA